MGPGSERSMVETCAQDTELELACLLCPHPPGWPSPIGRQEKDRVHSMKTTQQDRHIQTLV